MNKVKRMFFLFFTIILLVTLIIPYFITSLIYDYCFNYRYTTEEKYQYQLNDFENLNREKYIFYSNKNQKLTGYLYDNNKVEEKALVVFAHGLGGGGQVGYMDIFNYLTLNGFYVFAYDATGNDESEGKVVGGLPQGLIDLDYALKYIENNEKLNNFSLFLMGYSWGGYAISNALSFHQDIKAISSLAGFNQSLDLIKYQGLQITGKIGELTFPYVELYEKMKFGKYSSSNAIGAFKKSNAGIFIAHSEDDQVVPIKYGLDKYQEIFSTSDRFVFKRYSNRGHQVFVKDKYIKYVNDVESGIRKINKEDWINRIDYDLFDEIIAFYNMYL